MTIGSPKTSMSSSLNSHRTNTRDSSYYHQHQSHLETISPESSSSNSNISKSEKRHRSSTKKKHKHHRRYSSDDDNEKAKSLRSSDRTPQRSSSSKQHSRHEPSSSSNRYHHTRHTSNSNDYESLNKKRKNHHTDDYRSSKKHRRLSPSTIYSSHDRRSKDSKHRRRSTSSTGSSKRNSHSPLNQYENNQTGKLTKGTLGSELDKIRPKSKVSTSQTNENDIHQSISSSIIGQTHLTRSLPMPPDYQPDALSPNPSDKPIPRPL